MPKSRKQKLGDLTAREGRGILLYGFSGSGKTASVRHLNPESTLIVTCEPHGLATLQRFGWDSAHVIVPEDGPAFYDAVKEAVSLKMRVCVVDTVSRFHELLEQAFNLRHNVSPDTTDPKISRARFYACLVGTQALLETVLEVIRCGVTVVLLCHEKARTGEDIFRRPDIPGQLPEMLCRQMDLVAACTRRRTGSEYHYSIELPEDGIGKDMVGLSWPLDNDVALLLAPPAPTKTSSSTPAEEVAEKKSLPNQTRQPAAPPTSSEPKPKKGQDWWKDAPQWALEQYEKLCAQGKKIGKDSKWVARLLQLKVKHSAKLKIEHFMQLGQELAQLEKTGSASYKEEDLPF